jgi:hypothetical protein
MASMIETCLQALPEHWHCATAAAASIYWYFDEALCPHIWHCLTARAGHMLLTVALEVQAFGHQQQQQQQRRRRRQSAWSLGGKACETAARATPVVL